MGTVNLTPASLAVRPPAHPVEGPPAPGPHPTETLSLDVDGLRWQYCGGAETLLAAVPGAAWRSPEAQGWERVKHNPRREVWRAEIRGRAYYLKYHFRESWVRRIRHLFCARPCQVEWEGGLYTRAHGIAAVRPVAHTLDLDRAGRRCDLLITEAIEPATPLDEFWQQLQSDTDARRRRADVAQLCERLGELIARSHQAGFEHLDMHAANLLVQTVGRRRYQVFFIDLGSARRGAAVCDRAVVRNLAQLNQWFRKHSSAADRLRFLRAYVRWRLEYEQSFPHARPLGLPFAALVRALRDAARRHALRLGARRDHRVARSGRYFSKLKLAGGWRGYAIASCKHVSADSPASRLAFDRAWWVQQFSPPLRWFASAAATDCKQSHSGQVRRAVLQQGDAQLPVIIKRPRARNWRRALVQLWPPSRSMRGWRIGHALLHRDVPTARPLAVFEQRWGPLVRDSLLVTEALPGAVDLEQYLRRNHARLAPREWALCKHELARELAAHVRRLQENGFEHRDCKASNILVRDTDPRRLMWIDLDGLRLKRAWSRRANWRPLARLHVSLLELPGLTRTDRVRFLRQYLVGYGAPADAWRRLWPTLTRASRKKSRAKAARRAWKLKHYGRE